MKLQYCIFFLLILNSMTFAQESQRAQKVIEKVSNDSQKGNFVLVPGPSYMPSTKLGLSLIGMYLFDANSGKYKNEYKIFLTPILSYLSPNFYYHFLTAHPILSLSLTSC